MVIDKQLVRMRELLPKVAFGTEIIAVEDELDNCLAIATDRHLEQVAVHQEVVRREETVAVAVELGRQVATRAPGLPLPEVLVEGLFGYPALFGRGQGREFGLCNVLQLRVLLKEH